MLNIVIFGPPGAGKGTQSAKLAAKYNVVHLSTGDILRAERKAGTPLGKQAQDFINQGQLVPDSLVAGVLENEMNKYPKAEGFIFDGFPRTVEQVPMLDDMLQRRGGKLTVVVSLEVKNRDELIRRIVERGKLSDRADDQDPVVVGNRLKVYEDETSPVIDVYKFRRLYRGVNGEHMVEVVYAELCLRINAETAPLRVKGSIKVEAARAAAQERKAKRIKARKAAAEKEAKRLAAMEKLREPLPAILGVKEEKAAATTSDKKAAVKKTTKPAAKKVTKQAAKKTIAKKVTKPVAKQAAKKITAKKTVAKKVAKPAAKKVTKKSVAKKAVKKLVVKKTTKPAAKKVVAKKVTKKLAKPVAKKVVAKKPVAKKAPAKKAVAKKATRPVAKKKNTRRN